MSVASPAGTAPAPAAADAPDRPDAVRARRFWSARRNAAALAALVAVAAAGALLYEEIYIRSGNRAHAWRTWISDQLADRHLDDAWVIAGSAVVCALGLWLLLLAATPGLRRLLPLATEDTGGLRAALDRRAAAAMLRRAALETPGVREAGVKVGRRRARVRAVVGFGDPGEVKTALAEHLSVERGRLGLVRPPMVNVKVRTQSKGRRRS
ncbi:MULTISPECIES: DUF6286 domain-containing protein [Streptacidiphilus]|uniref:DUF6286 domain-containing protein n=1 Tax=Streptacidiphilus cavernicola TaxID=3342716 RepID=A0ABV6V0G0_9ACTN|nr:DUF6286 domain-containing protein [Streptacidiphilus jeojiense]